LLTTFNKLLIKFLSNLTKLAFEALINTLLNQRMTLNKVRML